MLIAFDKSHRACLRAKVALWHLKDGAVRQPDKWPAQAHAYLRLAQPALGVITKRVDRQQIDDRTDLMHAPDGLGEQLLGPDQLLAGQHDSLSRRSTWAVASSSTA